MAILDHPSIVQPLDPNGVIWRYMDFTKYVSLISTKSLFFSRLDLLGDPFEGSTTLPTNAIEIASLANAIKDLERAERVTKEFSKTRKDIMRHHYVNCWHMNDHESEAMWKLYSVRKEAVAVQSRYSDLAECLGDDVHLGEVKYVDYRTEYIMPGNVYYNLMSKRISFSHEREIRAIVSEFPTFESGRDIQKPVHEYGLSKPISLKKLITSVYISPTAPNWFAKLVIDVNEKWDFSAPVKKSSLTDTPVY